MGTLARMQGSHATCTQASIRPMLRGAWGGNHSGSAPAGHPPLATAFCPHTLGNAKSPCSSWANSTRCPAPQRAVASSPVPVTRGRAKSGAKGVSPPVGCGPPNV